ncbi:MAG: hypothetical protein QOG34_1648 [Frankiaceae bacterium]|nr:hypothetical protein [Frankiaceae bacterium]
MSISHRTRTVVPLALFGLAVALVPALSSSAAPANSACTTPQTCLTGSTFETGDGNDVVDFSPAGVDGVDWATASGASVHYLDTADHASGGSDNAFGQGAKEDVVNPNVVSGSIPPNKSDLTDFITAWDTKTVSSANHTFLYLKWKRTNVLGNANMDFEFNQNPPTSPPTPPTSKFYSDGTAVRTNLDMLISYDFGGSGTPKLSLFRWLAGGGAKDPNGNTETAGQCYSASALPCWGFGSQGNLSAANEANGGASADGKSGEAGIDLTAAGVFSATTCTTFGDALLKSRSSSSFTSEIKDFIQLPHGNIQVSNCGAIKVVKRDHSDGSALADAVFELTGPNSYDQQCTTAIVTDPTSSDFGKAICTFSNLPLGDYSLHEVSAPSAAYNIDPNTYTIHLTSASTITQTIDDTRAPATLSITKVDDASSPNPVAGAGFTAYLENPDAAHLVSKGSCTTYDGQTQAGDGSTPDAGTCTITGLVDAGTYIVRETTTPPGYDSASDWTVTVALGDSLSHTFTDVHQFKVITLVCQQSDNSLHAGSFTITSPDPGSGTSPTTNTPTTLSGLGLSDSASDLCSKLPGLSSQHRGQHNGNITIGAN